MVTCEPLTMATPLTSPVGLKSWIPWTVVPLGMVVRGPPLEIGVGSVTMTFICTTPPGGTDSFGMCKEICWVAAVHVVLPVAPPLVDPLVEDVLVPEPPVVDPEPGPPCAIAAGARRTQMQKDTLTRIFLMFKVLSSNKVSLLSNQRL